MRNASKAAIRCAAAAFGLLLSGAALHAQPVYAPSSIAIESLALPTMTVQREAAAPDTVAAQVAALKQQLAALDARVQPQASDQPAKPPTRVSVGPDGLSVTSGDSQHQLRVRGYLQADARLFASGGVSPSTFLMRRVRPMVEATMYGRFQVRIMPDFGEGRATVQDAYVDARFAPLVSVRVGKFKAPFGLERLMSATDLPFPERAMTASLSPVRDVGVMLQGQSGKERFSFALAFMNGVPDGASGDADTHEGKDFFGRVFVRPFPASAAAGLRLLSVGAAVSAGSENGVTSDPALPSYKTPGQQVFFRYRSDGTSRGTTIADGDRVRTSLQANWYAGPLGVMAEQTWSRQELTAGTRNDEVVNEAWMLTGTWMLTGGPAAQRRVSPRHAFDPHAGQWGALELDARYSQLIVDSAAFPVFADPASAARAAREWAIGCNWYLNRTVKIAGAFHNTDFDGGAADGDRRSERLVLTRLQFAF